MVDIPKLLTILNPSNWSLKNWAILMVASGAALGLPYLLGFNSLKEFTSGSVFIGLVIVFILATSGVLITTVVKLYELSVLKPYTSWKSRRKAAEAQAKRQRYLETLTIQEKQLLCGYLLTGSKTQNLQFDDGVVRGLERVGIIYLASELGTIYGCAYNISQWAWKYINQNPRLITDGVPVNEYGYVLPYEADTFLTQIEKVWKY